MLSRSLSPRSFLLSSFTACALAACATTAHAQVESTPEFTPAPPPAPAAPAPEPAPSAAEVPPADPGEAARERASGRESNDYWYGWQTLLADGGSLATMIAGGTSQSTAIGLVGLGGYFFGAPIVHGVQGRTGAAFASFGLRLGLPTLGAVVGYAAAGPCSASEHNGFFGCSFHGVAEAAVGVLIGAGTAVVLDAAWLARGTRRPEPAPRDSAAPRVTAVAPSYDPRTGTTSMGLGGTF
jgi:hypothetical protein